MCVVVKDQRKKFKKVVRISLELVPRALDDKEVEAVISKLFSEICKFWLTNSVQSVHKLSDGTIPKKARCRILLQFSANGESDIRMS